MCHCIAWSCYSTVHIPIVHIDFNDFLPAFVANVCRQSKQVMSSSRFYAPSVHSAHLFRCICSFLRVACRSCFYLFVSVISAHASRRYNSTDTSIHTHTDTHSKQAHNPFRWVCSCLTVLHIILSSFRGILPDFSFPHADQNAIAKRNDLAATEHGSL